MARSSSKPYDPQAIEEKIYRKWERAKAFTPAAAPKRGAKPFVILIPLPNVTGSLHMGHALQHSIMDLLTRYHRMLGDDALLVPGTDHAGIATQNVVEKELRKEGKTRHDLGREKFIERVWEWKKEYGDIINNQMRRLGDSCDWTRYHFTMDPDYARAVQEAFIHYARKGLIYRGDRIVNWCTQCASSISDLEVKYEEREGTLYFIKYPLSSLRAKRSNLAGNSHGIASSPTAPRNDGAGGYIVVATTRPETMLGDTAVAVNPKDERYTNLVGAEVEVPLTGRTVPIIADRFVDAEFGTGAVKVTPAHDHADAEMGERHTLPIINVIGEDEKMTQNVPEPYRGLTFEAARAGVLADLRGKNLIEKEETIRHRVSLCDRSNTVIQPLISKQWFVRMEPLAGPAINVVEDGIVTITPERWTESYLDWMKNIKDWCISRQLWWGHQLPVWYCQTGRKNSKFEIRNSSFTHTVFSVTKPRKCPECGGKEFVQDPDVLDTWFSSALWPLAVFGWPEATADLKRFYPTSILTTAQEILHLWVARMIFTGLEFTNRKNYLPARQYGKTNVRQQAPFHNVIIHQTVLNLKGQRMSKSLGTGVDPMDLIRQYGADATRFGLLVQVQHDQQALRFDEQAVKTGRNVVNKLWNIARFLQSVTGSKKTVVKRRQRPTHYVLRTTSFDNWILARSTQITKEVTEALRTHRFGDAIRTLHAFLWDEFADWYIEALKVEGLATPKVGRDVFQTLLRLLHPFMPFVTEELWSTFGGRGFIMHAPWPKVAKVPTRIPEEVELFKQVVSILRSLRNSMGIPALDNPLVRSPEMLTLAAHLPLKEALPFFAGYEPDLGVEEVTDLISVGSFFFRREYLKHLPLENQIIKIKDGIEKLTKENDALELRIRNMKNAHVSQDRLGEQILKVVMVKGELQLKKETLKQFQEVIENLR